MTKDINTLFQGTTGNIEGIISIPESIPKGIVFINHPHPLFGGSMTNKVVYTIHSALIESSWITVRYNFRGVGNSQGAFDNGKAESLDELKIIEQVLEHPSVKRLRSAYFKVIYAGFSFGAYVSCLVAEMLPPDHLLLLGAPPGKWNVPLPRQNTTLVHGENDEVIPLTDIFYWANQISTPVIVVAGASHFFDKKLAIVRRIVLEKGLHI